MASIRLFSQKFLNTYKTLPVNKNINNLLSIQHRLKTTFQYDCLKDPGPIFFKKHVQDMLFTLTRIDLSKVYRKRKFGTRQLQQPVYKFMTTDELSKAYQEAEEAVRELIQMPPVIKPRVAIDSVLSKDPTLQGLESSKIIFTDITFGISNKDRLIVIREPDGTLRNADWALRDQMNQVYFPQAGRELRTPKMFEEDNLKRLLEQQKYEFILDRTCLQFEPDDSEFHRITGLTYLNINEHNGFHMLRSTRHFGPMCFYLTWFKVIDNLLSELLHTGSIEEACCLIKLYEEIHKVNIQGENDILVDNYIKEYSPKRGQMELALQAFRELDKARRQLDDGINAAHGH